MSKIMCDSCGDLFEEDELNKVEEDPVSWDCGDTEIVIKYFCDRCHFSME